MTLHGDVAARQYCLSKEVVADEKDVASANAQVGVNYSTFLLSFTPDGAAKLRSATSGGKGQMGLIIDGELVMVAELRGPLDQSLAVGGGGLKQEDLADWVKRLNAQARRRAKQNIASAYH